MAGVFQKEIKNTIRNANKLAIEELEAECRHYTFFYQKNKKEYGYVLKLCKKAVKRGSIDAMFCLGALYEKKDLNKALNYYIEAAKYGDFSARNILGYLYATNNQIKDLKKSLYWYNEAADSGKDSQIYSLAQVFENKNSPLYNESKALELYKKAATNGYKNAIMKVIIYYYNCIFENNNYEEVDKNNGQEIKYTLNLNIEKNPKQKYDEFMDCINNASNEDIKELFTWTKIGCDFAIADTNFYMYIYYSNGMGCEVDEIKAFDYLKNAADLLCRDAWRHLADAYFYGKGTNKDHKKAYEWYLKLEIDDPIILERLGDILSFNDGVEIDYNQAFTYYWRAAELNNPYAQFKLAVFYEEGKGCNKNLEKAKEWYLKAAEQGIDAAKYRLYMDGHDIIV